MIKKNVKKSFVRQDQAHEWSQKVTLRCAVIIIDNIVNVVDT